MLHAGLLHDAAKSDQVEWLALMINKLRSDTHHQKTKYVDIIVAGIKPLLKKFPILPMMHRNLLLKRPDIQKLILVVTEALGIDEAYAKDMVLFDDILLILKSVAKGNEIDEKLSKTIKAEFAERYFCILINDKDDTGYTALHHAMVAAHYKNVALLLAAGIDFKIPFKTSPKNEVYPMALAVNAKLNSGMDSPRQVLYEDVIQLFLVVTEPSSHSPFEGNMHDAVQNNAHSEVVYWLCHGINVNSMNEDDMMLLHIAIQEKDKLMILILLAAGADKMIHTPDGHTSFNLAKELGYEEEAEIISMHTLLDRGELNLDEAKQKIESEYEAKKQIENEASIGRDRADTLPVPAVKEIKKSFKRRSFFSRKKERDSE